jgi:hypothetical protein
VISEITRAKPEVSFRSLAVIYRKSLVTLLGKFWVLNISTIYIHESIYRADLLLLPHGNTFNVVDSKSISNYILTQIHSLNIKLIQKIRYERFRYLMRVINRGKSVLRYIILIFGLIPFSSLLALDLFYFDSTLLQITSFIILGFTMTLLIIVPLKITKSLESKLVSYVDLR